MEHWASGSGRSVTIPVVGLWALELQGGMCLGMKKMDWNSELMKPFVLEGLPWWLRG